MYLVVFTSLYIALTMFLILIEVTIRLCGDKLPEELESRFVGNQVFLLDIRWPLRMPKGPPAAF